MLIQWAIEIMKDIVDVTKSVILTDSRSSIGKLKKDIYPLNKICRYYISHIHKEYGIIWKSY